ncbi:Uncharacterized conserved protein [Asanoa hainanensis]|uniref:Uncharacterized conserved protein n=1 Tax=Asanoa hainanensis TaxID=560556 RepID=A0A239N3B4_9ACTN|nr:GFA family protein [Asanoa hainanensis]SNT48924.1 Uncharacterized conserved protein [Asanoa hainanensis]
MELSKKYNGHCACGAVSYGFDTEPTFIANCHCTNCGSRVYTDNLKDFPGTVFVQEGTLDRLDEWIPPNAEIFTWSRQGWVRPLDVPQYDHRPPA